MCVSHVLGIQGRSEVVPVGDLEAVGLELGVGTVVHIGVNGLKERSRAANQVGDRKGRLAILSRDITTGSSDKVTSRLARAELQTKGHTTKFPLVELPTGGVALTLVTLDADTSGLEDGDKAVNLRVKFLTVLIGALGSDTDGDNDNLRLSHTGGRTRPLLSL